MSCSYKQFCLLISYRYQCFIQLFVITDLFSNFWTFAPKSLTATIDTSILRFYLTATGFRIFVFGIRVLAWNPDRFLVFFVWISVSSLTVDWMPFYSEKLEFCINGFWLGLTIFADLGSWEMLAQVSCWSFEQLNPNSILLFFFIFSFYLFWVFLSLSFSVFWTFGQFCNCCNNIIFDSDFIYILWSFMPFC